MSQRATSEPLASSAVLYDSVLVPAIYQTWARFVVDAAETRRGDRALDIACGTGVVTRLLAERIGVMGEVTGLDIDAAMLAVARASFPRVNGWAPVDWEEGSANAVNLRDESIDVITCQQGLPYFSNRATAVREMYRLLTPGGRLSMMVWRNIERSPGFAAFVEVVERYAGVEAAAPLRAPFCMDNAEEIQSLLRQSRFRDSKIESATGSAVFESAEPFIKSQILGTPLARVLTSMGMQAMNAFYADVSAALARFTGPHGVVFPMSAFLISAKK